MNELQSITRIELVVVARHVPLHPRSFLAAVHLAALPLCRFLIKEQQHHFRCRAVLSRVRQRLYRHAVLSRVRLVALMGSRHLALMGSRHLALMGSRHLALMGSRHLALMGSRHLALMGSRHLALMGSRLFRCAVPSRMRIFNRICCHLPVFYGALPCY